MKSYIGFGYIEKVKKEESILLYNSLAVIDRKGKLICNYRKTHLYYNDKMWAQEGPGFVTFELTNLKG